MVRWAMEPMLARGRVAMLGKHEDKYRSGDVERWHREHRLLGQPPCHRPDPQPVVLVLPEPNITMFLATEPLGGERGEPRSDRWVDLREDCAAALLDDLLSGVVVRSEAFYFRGFGPASPTPHPVAGLDHRRCGFE